MPRPRAFRVFLSRKERKSIRHLQKKTPSPNARTRFAIIILKRNDLKPHLSAYWCIPPDEDADFVANMEDVLAIYQRPYDPKHPVWCMDEKPYQILGNRREPIPMRPGDVEKIDYQYLRNGVVAIFCFIQPHTGRIVHAVEETRTAVDWAEKIKFLEDEVASDAEKITLIMDNLNTHKESSYHFYFPKSTFFHFWEIGCRIVL